MEPGLKQTEILMLLVGLAALLFLGLNWRRLAHVPHRRLIAAAVASLAVAWLATNLEELLWRDFFNLIDHLGYALFGALICLWCLRLSGRPGGAPR